MPGEDPPPPPPPPHICTRTQATPAGTVHCVVQVAPEPLPQDHADMVSPEMMVEPSNTSASGASVPPLLPLTCVHVLSGLHRYRFWPPVASVLKNASPVEHVPGNVVPDFAGFVVCAFEASQSPFIVRPPILVLCP
jgi:hypothetical protein